jgi:hypothetical protein
MRAFMARSIELIGAQQAESGAFRVTPHGYLYCSSAAGAAAAYAAEARDCHGGAGGGGARLHGDAASAAAVGCAPFSTSSPLARGADVYTTPAAVHAAFPYLSPAFSAVMHTRNCGWVSAQTMGMDMLDTLRAGGAGGAGGARVTVVTGRVVGGDVAGGRVRGVTVAPVAGAGGAAGAAASAAAPTRLTCGAFINASGPFLADTHRALTGAARGSRGELPVRNEVHSKVIFRDVLGAIPRDAPQVILAEPARPLWDASELEYLAEAHGAAVAARAAAMMPSGAHFRPYGGPDSNAVLMLWEAWHHNVTPSEPPPDAADEYLDKVLYPEIALRGLANAVPGLRAYFEEGALARWRAARGGAAAPALRPPATDGGYYTKTEENFPLIGPAPAAGGEGHVEGAFLCGALSGYGIMAGHAAGELVALHATGASALPSYAALMSPMRYQDAGFTRPGGVRDQLIATGGGQL